MTQEDGRRPDPEAVLAEANKHRRGKLRLFLGMAPGVGKTYAMLTEAHQRRTAGLDILIGWVDTHNRQDTDALTRGLDILPRKLVRRGNIMQGVLDVDEIIRRRPSVVVIDEMPHSNPPGQRHAKRWQDIEEILNVGIDVWSALNIQHLESLNGVVERVTGVAVTETVPDRVFDEADEVRLIDLPPDDLLTRLAAGKIYLPAIVERAKSAYFKRSNLIALRELALRCMASRMESQIRSERLRSTRRGVEDTSYGLLLVTEVVSEEPIREAARIARALSSPWHVVWMEGFGNERGDSPEVRDLLKFADELGAQTDVLAGDYGAETSRYARDHNLSLVSLIATSQRASAARRRELSRKAPELNLLTLSSQNLVHVSFAERLARMTGAWATGWEGYWAAVGVVLAFAIVLYPLHLVIEPTNHAMLYLLGVLFCGVRYGSGPAALAAVLSVVAFDISLIAPQWSFTVADTQYVITFVVMLTVGLVAGQLVTHRQNMMKAANEREHQARMLYETSRELSRVVSAADVYEILSSTLSRQLGLGSEYWIPSWESDEMRREHPDTVELERFEAVLKKVDPAIVRWCYEHHQPAGAGTSTLASAPCRYVPMTAGGRVLCVMVVRDQNDDAAATGATTQLVDSLALLGAQTVLRIESAEEARETLVSMESDRLRYGLIQSLSHDLRTPIALLKAACERLLAKLKPEAAASLKDATEDAEKLLEGTTRMERLVGNLLEMARLQTGEIVLNKCWIPAEELFGTSVAELGERLSGYTIDVRVAPECPPVYGDEVLLVRVLVNLLDNAAKYCPPGSMIVLSAKRRGDVIALTVADNGPGLPEGNPQRLFDPFRRGQKENSIAGVGLGLAICRTIVRAHDAEIFATSSVFGGAAFTIALPYVELEDLDDEDKVLALGKRENAERSS